MYKNLLIGFFFFGLVPLAKAGDYQVIDPIQIANWEKLDFKKSLETFKKSCHFHPNQADGVYPLSKIRVTQLCQQAKTVKPSDAKVFFEQQFKAYRIQDGQDTLMTAYYAPMFDGRLSQSSNYRFPVYAKPKNLLEINFKSWRFIGRFRYGFFLAYPSRREIMEQGLNEKAEVIAWLKDPLDVLELEIQGSGVIKTPQKVIYLNYAAQNGHQYQPIGKFLIQDGKIPKERMSITAIRDYFKQHPEELKHYLYQNPSYVFFKVENSANFYGYHDTVLTPGYSLAVDPKFLPMGMPFLITTILPNQKPFERLMIAQDTGGAIKGLHHVDLYLGKGVDAQENARKMQAKGQYWVLLPTEP